MDRDEERQIFRSKIPELFKLVDQNKEKLIDSLKEPVSIPSVSNDPDHSEDILKMVCTFNEIFYKDIPLKVLKVKLIMQLAEILFTKIN